MNPSLTVNVDTVLHRAGLLDGRTVDVHIAAGHIVTVTETGKPLPSGATIHDPDHWLLLPAMAEPHAHLDKALIAATTRNETGDLFGAIDAMGRALDAGRFTHDNLVERATAAVEMLIRHGVTAVRSHVNVGEGIGARFVAAIAEVRTAFRDLIDLEIVGARQANRRCRRGVPRRQKCGDLRGAARMRVLGELRFPGEPVLPGTKGVQ